MRKKRIGHLVKTNPNKANSGSEDRWQRTDDSLSGVALAKTEKQKTYDREDSKIRFYKGL